MMDSSIRVIFRDTMQPKLLSEELSVASFEREVSA